MCDQTWPTTLSEGSAPSTRHRAHVRGLASTLIGAGDNEFIRGPKWRTRTTPARRARAAVLTFAGIVAVGTVVMVLPMWALDRLGAPSWVVVAIWVVPTLGAVAWALLRPVAAVATDDDDDGWTTYSIQYVVIGDGSPRPAPVRMIAAALFGAPLAWSLLVFGLSTLVGLF